MYLGNRKCTWLIWWINDRWYSSYLSL